MTDDADENPLIAERRAKLAQLRARGRAFPNDFHPNALAAELLSEHAQHDEAWLEAHAIPIRVAGRMMFKRVMGKASFLKIADRSGQIQLYLQANALGESYEQFKTYDVGDILGAEGVLFRTRTGELSVRVERLRLLTKSLRPLPDKWHGLEDTELRYRQRYVDLIMNASSRATFVARTRIVRWLREFLDRLGFMEVETPMMQPLAGGAAARPFITRHNALDQTMYLRIAPELYLKRLLVGGFERVYEINRNFRNEGLSTRHNPEFTMLELYWAYAEYQQLMELTERMLRSVCEAVLGTTRLHYQQREYDLGRPFRRLSIEQAILEANPSLERARLRDPSYLRSSCAQLGVRYQEHEGPGKLQLELFEKTAEHLLIEPTYVYGYPVEVSPLSRANDQDAFLSDRFELFIAGRELANGFSELNDPEDQATRFRAQLALKHAGDEEAMQYDADYIRALEYGMPPAAGLGLGIDRLVMLLTDSASIRDVLLFPHLRPESHG